MSPDEEASLMDGGTHGWSPLSVAPSPALAKGSLSLVERFKQSKEFKGVVIVVACLVVALLIFGLNCLTVHSTGPQSHQVQDSIEGQDGMSKPNEALVLGRVIGDVIDSVRSPPADLKVQYDSRKVTNGAQLKPSETAAAPVVEIAGMVNSELYTLVMVDPDAPSPSEPLFREWLHWIVVDIPGASSVPPAGKEVVEYNGPTPPIGIHRYVFVLFKQKGPITVTPPSTRKSFNTRAFAQQYDLGVPVAAVYFNAQKEGPGGRRR